MLDMALMSLTFQNRRIQIDEESKPSEFGFEQNPLLTVYR